MISVIIPVYNCEKYINDCIDSVLKQTYKDYEIIIINDGSSDLSLTYINKYKDYKNIHIIDQDNKGLSASRNIGIDNAKGDYICFLDADDMLHPFFLEYLVTLSKDKDADFVGCNYVTFDRICELNFSNLISKGIYIYKSINKYLSPDDGFYTQKIISCAKLYKRSLFNSLRFDVGRYHEDEFIIHNIVALSKIAIFADVPYYFYRNNYAGITKSIRNDKKTLDACDAFLDRIQFLRKMGVPYTDNSIGFAIQLAFNYSNPNAINKRMSLHYLKIISLLSKHLFLRSYYVHKRIGFPYIVLMIMPFLAKPFYKIKDISPSDRKSLLLYRLKYRLYYCYNAYIKKCNIAYVGSIIHSNLGDQAIAKASLVFLKEMGLKPIDIPSDRLNDKVINYLRRKNIMIALRGGGNIGNDWLNEEQFHRRIISALPNNRIIFFPETIHFTSDEEGEKESQKSKIIYSRHKDLIIACREKKSYSLSIKLFNDNQSILCPDIVFRLKSKFKVVNKPHSNRVCFIIRGDKEKVENNKLLFSEIKEYFIDIGYKIEYSSTIANKKVITMFEREKALNSFLKELSCYDYVVTDRLHAMIFSFILNIPCVVLDNSTNKISSSYEWIKQYGMTLLYHNKKQLIDFTKKITFPNENDHDMEDNFNPLKSIFTA